MAVSVYSFMNSIAVNTHMSYTDGAYANVANVAADLSYLGITTIRDAVPNPNGGVPAANQISALEILAADGIKFDLLASATVSIAQTMQQIEALDEASPGCVVAVEGPNEINNNPATYDGLTGQAAATAYQTALYAAIKGNAATAGIDVYDYTGGVASPLTVAGTITNNANGSYTLVNGQTGFPVTLPAGISTIKLTYTGAGTPDSGLYGYPGQGQVSSIAYGSNGTIAYIYDNTSGASQALYVDFADWGDTQTLTGVSVTASGNAANLVTFDPALSLAGQADDANIHPYPSGNAPIESIIASEFLAAFGSATPGPRVITETGYTTDPDVANGVTQLEQAQQVVNGLFDAYASGVSTTYIYELLDEKSDPSDTNSQMHYGLFGFDNTPKLAATALHDLTAILADTGADAATFQPGTMSYTETGATASDHAMLLEKSDGVFDLALWNDADPGTAAADPITVSFGQTYQNVTVFDVITDAATRYANVSEVSLGVGGDAMVIEIDPNQSSLILDTKAAITASVLNAAASMSFLAAASSAASSDVTSNVSPAGTGNIAVSLGVADLYSSPAPSLSPAVTAAGSLKSMLAAGLSVTAAALAVSRVKGFQL